MITSILQKPTIDVFVCVLFSPCCWVFMSVSIAVGESDLGRIFLHWALGNQISSSPPGVFVLVVCFFLGICVKSFVFLCRCVVFDLCFPLVCCCRIWFWGVLPEIDRESIEQQQCWWSGGDKYWKRRWWWEESESLTGWNSRKSAVFFLQGIHSCWLVEWRRRIRRRRGGVVLSCCSNRKFVREDEEKEDG